MDYPGSTEYLNNNRKLPPVKKGVVFPVTYMTLELFLNNINLYLKNYTKELDFLTYKSLVNNLISLLLNNSNYVTLSVFNSTIQSLPLTYITFTQYNTDLNNYVKKNNISQYIPTKLSLLTNDSDYVNVSLLNCAINNIDLSLYKLVTELPTTNISTSKIYLVKSKSSATNDSYGEYIYDDTNHRWEKLGELYLSIADYVALDKFNSFTNLYNADKQNYNSKFDSINLNIELNYSELTTIITNSQALMLAAWNNAINEKYNSLFDTDNGYFTGSINPLAVKTTCVLVGSTSGNFLLQLIIFRPNSDGDDSVSHTNTLANPKYDYFYVEVGDSPQLIHYGISGGSSSSSFIRFSMTGGSVNWYDEGVLTTNPNDDEPYYLYAVCLNTSLTDGIGTGYFILDTKLRTYDEGVTIYDYNGNPKGIFYFLVGVLSSKKLTHADYTLDSDGNETTTNQDYYLRLLNCTYGLTTIDGGLIKTGKISSIDGLTYFDLDRGVISGRIHFVLDLSLLDDIINELFGEDLSDLNTIITNSGAYSSAIQLLLTALNSYNTAVSLYESALSSLTEAVAKYNETINKLNNISEDGQISKDECDTLLITFNDAKALWKLYITLVNTLMLTTLDGDTVKHIGYKYVEYNNTHSYIKNIYSILDASIVYDSDNIPNTTSSTAPVLNVTELSVSSFISTWHTDYVSIDALWSSAKTAFEKYTNWETNKVLKEGSTDIYYIKVESDFSNISTYMSARILSLEYIVDAAAKQLSDLKDYTDVLKLYQDKLKSYLDTMAKGGILSSTKYAYLKEALAGSTDMYGGLVLTNTIMLKDRANSTKITAGINGITLNQDPVTKKYYKTTKNAGTGDVEDTTETQELAAIAAWYGGDMIDRYADVKTENIFGNIKSTGVLGNTSGAMSLFRHDGSGYLAGGNIVWGTDGKLWANLSEASIGTISLSTLNISSGSSTSTNTQALNLYYDDLGYLVLPKTKIQGNLISLLEVVAYGMTDSSDYMTVLLYVNDYLTENGVGGSGITWDGFGTSEGNAVSNLTYDASTNTLSGTKAKFLAIEGTDLLSIKIKDGYISFYDGSQYIPMYGAYNSNNKLVLDLGNTGYVSEFYGSAFDFYCANGGSAVKLLAIDRTNGLTSSGDVKAKDSSNNTHSLIAKADKATTLSGYGITDAKIASGVITLGSNTITPLTSHQSLNTTEYTVESSGTTSASVNILGRNIHNLHRAGHLVWTSGTTHRLITLGTLAYWDGQYDSSKSNLKYCADGTICSTSVADSKISTAIGALTKSSVGLGNVDNTADSNKNVLSAKWLPTCSSRTGNKNTYPYHRILASEVIKTQYYDNASVYLIHQGYNGGNFGIFRVYIRSNGSGENSSAAIQWLVNVGFSADKLQGGFRNTQGNTYLDVYYKATGTYDSVRIERLEESNRGFTEHTLTMINAYENNDDSSISEVYAQLSTETANITGRTYTHILTATDISTSSKLTTSRSLWGNNFNGTQDISGDIKVDGDYGMVISSNAITNYESATWKGDAWQITGTWSGNGDDNKMLIKTSAQGSSEPSWVNAIAILCSSGKVGIGTISPSEKLHVVGNEYIETSSTYGLTLFRKNTNSGAWMRFMNNNQSTKVWYHGMSADDKYKFVYNAGSDVVCATIDISGNIIAKGDVTAYSDARLKSEIKPLTYRGSLEPKEYVKDGKKSIGFIAQEVRELYPELVIGEEKEDEYLSLNYGAITAVLAAENKHLKDKVNYLEDRLNKMELLINKLILNK